MPKGEVQTLRSNDRRLIAERFWSRVKLVPGNNPKLGYCWEWTGARDRDGYGQFRYQRRQSKAHRVVLILLGVNLSKPQSAHRCDNPPCVRPSHLFAATPRENTIDMMAKGRHVYVCNLPRVLAARNRRGVN